MYHFFINENTSNGDYMTKKITTISILILSIILVSTYVVKSTYSIFDNLLESENETITLVDIFKEENGEYNEIYYVIKRELNLTYEEFNTLITSISLNNALEIILKDNNKLNKNDFYNLIVDSLMEDTNISISVKEKIINRLGIYLNDIIYYLDNYK